MECAKLYIKPSGGNRDLLDSRLLHFRAFVRKVREPDGSYEVRCIEETIKTANARAELVGDLVKRQGYGEVVRIEPAVRRA